MMKPMLEEELQLWGAAHKHFKQVHAAVHNAERRYKNVLKHETPSEERQRELAVRLQRAVQARDAAFERYLPLLSKVARRRLSTAPTADAGLEAELLRALQHTATLVRLKRAREAQERAQCL